MRKSACVFLLLSFFNVSAHSNEVADRYLGQSKLLGQAPLHFLFWHIYDASLYATNTFSFDTPFALTIEYKRKLFGEKIADRSAKEMRKIGYNNEVTLAAWHTQMREIFPDVSNGSTLTGIYQPQGETIFYHNGTKIGSIKDPEFGKWFFGIWLSQHTSEPAMRRKLIGQL